jgi:hypothetical protein
VKRQLRTGRTTTTPETQYPRPETEEHIAASSVAPVVGAWLNNRVAVCSCNLFSALFRVQ